MIVRLVNGNIPEGFKIEAYCPTCGEFVESLPGYVATMVGYLSPEGHDHDANCRRWTFHCKAGHTFTVRVINTCPAPGCDWESPRECGVCGPNIQTYVFGNKKV